MKKEMFDIDENKLFNMLSEHLPEIGCFIEIGCRDGRDHSLFLSKNGWSGYCIEANPDIANSMLVETHKNNDDIKTFNYCVTDKVGHVDFYIEDSPKSGVSSIFKERASGNDSGINRRIKKKVSVESITLFDFWLNENSPQIDLLLIDTEGSDANILLSTDFSEFKPNFIMAETTFLYYNREPHKKENNLLVWDEVNNHLGKNGYEVLLMNNILEYKNKYCPELMDTPMNTIWKLII